MRSSEGKKGNLTGRDRLKICEFNWCYKNIIIIILGKKKEKESCLHLLSVEFIKAAAAQKKNTKTFNKETRQQQHLSYQSNENLN